MNLTPAPAPMPAAQTSVPHPQGGHRVCANCGTPVTGLYCGHCGQRVDHHLLTLREFLGEVAEVLTHADSRLWHTLVPLLLKPGLLTREFLSGRRASYLSPFRLYLLVSVLFFLIASLTTTGGTGVVHDPTAARAAMAETAAELNKELDAAVNPAEQTELRRQLQQLEKIGARRAPRSGADGATDGSDEPSSCSDIFKNTKPNWLAPRLLAACEKTKEDSGRELGSSVMHNLGRAMFIFLPVFAALMKLLYWRPRRYYVEHLLLLLHNHAFVFLIMATFLGAAHFIASDGLNATLMLALLVYVVYYLYESMRQVYRQRSGITLAKFTALATTYCIFGLVTLLLTAVFSAATL